MNYDRRLHRELLALFLPGGPFAWLPELVRSAAGDAQALDLQLRGYKANRAVQLYAGRGSLLEIQLRTSDDGPEWLLHADETYAKHDRGLFELWRSLEDLDGVKRRLQSYLAAVAAKVGDDGEGLLQTRLSRLHGLCGGPQSPVRIIDREAEVSYNDEAERTRIKGQFTEQLGRSWTGKFARKIDAIGVLPDGRPALIELKLAGDADALRSAAEQLAAYVFQFRMLEKQWTGWATLGLLAIVQQKAALGLLPNAPVTVLKESPRRVIAAIDDRAVWKQRWAEAISPIQKKANGLLDDLELWRLDQAGTIVESTHV
jgi:hypothetical protein